MQFPHIFVVATLGGLMAAQVWAGTRTSEITVVNTGTARLSCAASVAHWYSVALGEIAPGDRLAFTVETDVASGTVFLRNAKGDQMPVQRLWCGVTGRDWATRADIPLDRRAGEMPEPVQLDCAAAGDMTVCAAP